jgi:lipopolysaccharide biosynthesis regulator YciM
MTDSAAADFERADGLVAPALAAAPGSALVHLVKGHVLRAQNRWEQVIPEFETALALNRNFVGALQGLGQCKLLAGSIDEVIPLEKSRSAMPASPVFRTRLASVLCPQGRHRTRCAELAEAPRLVGSHLSRRPAQSRSARGVTDTTG